MTKAELVEDVAEAAELTKKDAERLVEIVFESIIETLNQGEKIELRGFGSFRVRERGARRGRNPKTGDPVSIPAKRVPYFKPGKELKELINNGAQSHAPSEQPVALPKLRHSRTDETGAGAQVIYLSTGSKQLDRLWSPWRSEYIASGTTLIPIQTLCFLQSPRRVNNDEANFVVYRGARCFIVLNRYPYISGHLLIVPYDHVGELDRLSRQLRTS